MLSYSAESGIRSPNALKIFIHQQLLVAQNKNNTEKINTW